MHITQNRTKIFGTTAPNKFSKTLAIKSDCGIIRMYSKEVRETIGNLMIMKEVIIMYELKRIYTCINECYVQGKGWTDHKAVEKGDVITMYALEYIDIDDNGIVHSTGVEDFSVERFKKLGFGVMELKNKVEKEKKTYKTAYRHELVKRVFFRYRNKKHGKAFKEYLNSRYGKELLFNEIIATYH